MKACNYFQILHEGDVLPLLQVGKKVALMQIFFFIFCSFSFEFLQKLHRLRPENGSHRHINQFLHITEMKLLLFVRKKHHIKQTKKMTRFWPKILANQQLWVNNSDVCLLSWNNLALFLCLGFGIWFYSL